MRHLRGSAEHREASRRFSRTTFDPPSSSSLSFQSLVTEMFSRCVCCPKPKGGVYEHPLPETGFTIARDPGATVVRPGLRRGIYVDYPLYPRRIAGSNRKKVRGSNTRSTPAEVKCPPAHVDRIIEGACRRADIIARIPLRLGFHTDSRIWLPLPCPPSVSVTWIIFPTVEFPRDPSDPWTRLGKLPFRQRRKLVKLARLCILRCGCTA